MKKSKKSKVYETLEENKKEELTEKPKNNVIQINEQKQENKEEKKTVMKIKQEKKEVVKKLDMNKIKKS